MSGAEPGSSRRPRRRACVFLVGGAILAAMAIRAVGRAETPSESKSKGLVVWVLNNDRTGVAIAFNQLRKARDHDVRYSVSRHDGDPWERASLHTILTGLVGTNEEALTGAPVPASSAAKRNLVPRVRLEWGKTGTKWTTDPPYQIVFKFAPSDGLLNLWRPLFHQLAAAQRDEDQKKLAVAEGVDNDEPQSKDAVAQARWLAEMLADVERDRKGEGHPLIFLGPDDSDSVPAFWFALRHGRPEKTRYPPAVSLAATSSLLDYEQDTLRKPDDKDADQETKRKWFPRARSSTLVHHEGPDWYTSLGRMMGYCEDDFASATDLHKGDVGAVVAAIREPAASFMQFPESDRVLVTESLRYLKGVQGYQRIGILYPDGWLTNKGGPHPASGGVPGRRLYGPTLRREYLSRAEVGPHRADILPAAYPIPDDRDAEVTESAAKPGHPGVAAPAPTSVAPKENWDDAAFRKKFADKIRPTLQFFRQSKVEAVGVFGVIDAKLLVLQLAREELPQAQMFTSDANSRLETTKGHAPVPRDGDAKGADAAKEKPVGGGAGAASSDGLLVFTNSQSPPDWVRNRFVELTPYRSEPVLPDIFQFYTDHTVIRLVELVTQGRSGLVREAGDPKHPTSIDELTLFLHDESRPQWGTDTGINPNVQNEVIDVMVVKDGQLGPLADPAQLALAACIVALPLTILLLQFRWQRSSRVNARSRSRRRGTIASDPVAEPEALASDPVAQPQVSPLYYLYAFATQVRLRFRRGRATRRHRADSPVLHRRWARLINDDDTLLVSLCVAFFLALAILAVALDGIDKSVITAPFGQSALRQYWTAKLRGIAVSWSPWPDGHSIIPSMILAGMAAVLAHHLPYRLEAGMSRQGLIRGPGRRRDVLESWVLRRWAPPFSQDELETRFDGCVKGWVVNDVVPALEMTRAEAAWTALAAAIPVLLDVCFGLPIPGGFTYAVLLVGEFLLCWIVIATAWTLYQVSEMPSKLQARLNADPNLRLGHLDTSSVTRLGSIFVENIAYLLVVLGLLLVTRLPEYGMARWRKFDIFGISAGAFIAALALACILWYWLHCYTTLKDLIRSVKLDRLDELEVYRRAELKRSAEAGAEGRKKEEQDLKKAADEMEKERRAIEEVSEEPWHVAASWRAWVALGVIILPTILSAAFGTWGDTLMRPLRLLTGGL